MDDATLTRLREELEHDRQQQLDMLTENGADPYSDAVANMGSDDGFADSAQATASRSETLALIDVARTRLQQIDSALQQMDEGTYGVCENCGKRIDAERLEARPLSTLCVDCAAAAEDAAAS